MADTVEAQRAVQDPVVAELIDAMKVAYDAWVASVCAVVAAIADGNPS